MHKKPMSLTVRNFMFATGIECSYPTITLPDGSSKRIDQLEKCCHYKNWQRDFDLVKEMGIGYLRYGPPYYKMHLAPGKFDWDFTDLVIPAMKKMDITPIIDLCHFGVPDWCENFQNPAWPDFFAEWAGAFARRYPQIHLYTPVNEIFIAALFSAQYGWWNEKASDSRSFVTAMKHLCQANVKAMYAILEVNPEAIFIQSESSEYFHPEGPRAQDEARFLNQRRFLALDLTYGRAVNSIMYEYLLDNGMTREEYHWFLDQNLKGQCVMGTDYYETNEHVVCEDGTVCDAGEIFGYYALARQYYDRYKLPVMHTETNISEDRAVKWLRKEWANMHRLKLDGVPILGFTWYSLTDQMDWDTAMREENNRIYRVGLYDLDRNIRDVGVAYKELIKQWQDILPTWSYAIRANI